MISRLQDAQQQSDLLAKLNALVLQGSTPPAVIIPMPPLLPRIVHDIFVELAEALPDLAKRERETFGLAYKPFTAPAAAGALAGGLSPEDAAEENPHSKDAHSAGDENEAGAGEVSN